MTDPGTTGRGALRAATARLAAAGVEGAAGDARVLLAHVWGVPPGRLTQVLSDPLPAAVTAAYDRAVAARAARQPVAQITGTRLFWGRPFRVTPDVLDPRPETEVLVDLALRAPFDRVLDLGTGSGCILLTLLAERPAATGLGIDISAAALAVAAGNARALGLDGRAAFAQSDWLSAVDGSFDLIVSNPPYIAAAEMLALTPEVRDWEPATALTPGGDGLAAYRAIAAAAPQHLAPGGRLLLEIGAAQGPAVAALLADAGWRVSGVHPDLDGRDRVVAAVRP